MSIEKEKLLNLVMASGFTEWYAVGDLRYADDKTGEIHGLHHDDDSFIAAASPAAVKGLLDEIEALRKDAERYRFVSKLAWYVDAASHVYNVCNVNAQWSDQRGHPDTDDIESAIDATMAGGKDQ